MCAFFLSSSVAFAAQECDKSKYVCLVNPISADNVPELVNLILKGLFGIVGTVALLIFLYGGFTWMTAQGQEKKIKQGWDTLTWGALGLALIFGSYIIVQFLLGILLPPTVPPGGGGGAAPASAPPAIMDSTAPGGGDSKPEYSS